MKKIVYYLICLIGCSACVSENISSDTLKIYDVSNSACKLHLSQKETRSDFYYENEATPATFNIELEKDGMARCVFKDVKANCAARNIYVIMTNKENLITLVLYHNVLDAFADCICKYDIYFKISKLTPANYQLKVYYARPNMEYDESSIAYNGPLNLVQNNKEKITLTLGNSLPEN